MERFINEQPIRKSTLWVGWVLSAIPVLLMLFGAGMSLLKPAAVLPGFRHYGFADSTLVPICVLEICIVLLYVIPRTSVLGGLLLIAYLGGATATHVRMGESPLMPILVAVIAWLGLYLRDTRLRALVPLRSGSSNSGTLPQHANEPSNYRVGEEPKTSAASTAATRAR